MLPFLTEHARSPPKCGPRLSMAAIPRRAGPSGMRRISSCRRRTTSRKPSDSPSSRRWPPDYPLSRPTGMAIATSSSTARHGFLIPTVMVDRATVGVTARLLIGDLTYDHFLAECSQATAVDVSAMAAALTRLVGDNDLRRRMGEAGVPAAHTSPGRGLSKHTNISGRTRRRSDSPGPGLERTTAAVRRRGRLPPAPRRTRRPANFGSYPTIRLKGHDRVVPGPARATPSRFSSPCRSPTMRPAARSGPGTAPCGHRPGTCSVRDLDEFWSGASVEHGIGRASLAWMLKYDLLRAVCDGHTDEGRHR